jgi:hypothetical protein
MFWKTKLPLWFATIAILIAGLSFVSVIMKYNKIFEQTYAVVPLQADPACNGSQNQYYDIGFGTEHHYSGEVAPDIKVKITLSCDHTRFFISGDVNQVIATTTELADLVAGTEVVRVENDYNFDGYNDLSTIWSNGSGQTQIDSSFIFLYNPASNKFILDEKLSSLENSYPKSDTKEIIQYFNFVQDGYQSYSYKWTMSGKLYKSKDDSCQSNRQIDQKSEDIEYYIHEVTKYASSGKVISHTKKELSFEEAQNVCVFN